MMAFNFEFGIGIFGEKVFFDMGFVLFDYWIGGFTMTDDHDSLNCLIRFPKS